MTKRRVLLSVVAAITAGGLRLGASPAAALAQGAAEPLARGVEIVGYTVRDMDRSVDFFTKVLSFEKASDVEVVGDAYERLQGVFGLRMRVVRLRLGEEQVELTEYLAPRGRSIPEDSRSNDRWFQHIAIVVSDMDKAYAWLRQNKVAHASTGPQRLPDWNKNAGGIKAFYFKDPDGHALEVLEFPPDKGLAKWHTKTDRLFLGIDHTAIAIANTDESLTLYRDVLGLKVAGGAENYGTEQEHLNNVFGARLRITGLRGAFGPGIEFLEYLSPRDGRATPVDLRPNDLAHWQTTLVVDDAGEAARRLFERRALFLSPGAVALPGRDLGFAKGLTLRDPDGHALRLVQK